MRFKPFPVIESKRLFLRNIEESDCEEVLFLRSDKTINKFIERPENRKTKNISDALKFIKELKEYIENNTSIAWGITLKNDSKIIGTICLWNFSQDNKIAEVGYDLNPQFQGKGIMNEALQSILEFGFINLNLASIEAYTHQANESSKKLLERNKFELIEGKQDKQNLNNIIYEIEKPVVNNESTPKTPQH